MMTSDRCIKFNLLDEFLWKAAKVNSSHHVRHRFWPGSAYTVHFKFLKFELYCIITVFKIALAVGKCQSISMFFSICLSQKMLRQLNNNDGDVFHTNFKLDFLTQIIYCIIHIILYSLFIFLLFSYISFWETGHKKNTNPFLFIEVAGKVQQNEWKKKPGVSECGPWVCSWAK